MKCDGLTDKSARAILRDLRSGYGVEDIAYRGTATIEQARRVVSFLNEHNLTEKFYRNSKEGKKE